MSGVVKSTSRATMIGHANAIASAQNTRGAFHGFGNAHSSLSVRGAMTPKSAECHTTKWEKVKNPVRVRKSAGTRYVANSTSATTISPKTAERIADATKTPRLSGKRIAYARLARLACRVKATAADATTASFVARSMPNRTPIVIAARALVVRWDSPQAFVFRDASARHAGVQRGKPTISYSHVRSPAYRS